MRNRYIACTLLLAGLSATLGSPVSAQGEHHGAAAGETGDLGELVFQNSGSPAAQPHFLRGVLLLHSFQYREAAEAFRRAQQADPGFAMAYWGEAMTYNRNFGREQDRAAAAGVLARLGGNAEEQLSRAPTAREKAYLAAVIALYGDGPKAGRDAAYASAMEQLAAAYPEDLEASAFHALALLGLHRRDLGLGMRAATIAERVFAANPRHPGAAHYLIHAYDTPMHAARGLRAATAYARLAPGAAHALHMPAHIFFRLGMWEESIEANVRSLAAERRGGRIGTHAMHWLVHAYLQQGRRDEAAAILRTLEADLVRSRLPQVRYAKAQICAVWVIETGSDRDAPCDGDIDRTGIVAVETFLEYELARGLVAARRSDLPAARGALQRMRDMIAQGRTVVSAEATPSPIDRVTEQSLQLGTLMSLQLEAALLSAEGRQEDALRRGAEAVEMEAALPFRTEPPAVPKPSRELLGELLLAVGRGDEARQQYETALERTPARIHSLVGLLQALERTGHPARAAVVREQVRRQWRRGDLPGGR